MRASGVYYQEFDLSQIATADGFLPAAIVGAFAQGDPYRRVLSTTPKEHTDRFGQPNPKIGFASYCALAYLAAGNQLWTVRATGAGAKYGSVLLQKKLGDSQVVTSQITPSTSQLLQNASALVSDTFDFSLNLVPATPAQFVVTPSPTGGSLVASVYSYAATSVNANGESAATALTSTTVTGSNSGAVSLQWAAVPGATGYNVYGRTSVNGKLALLASNVTSPSYVDTNVATPSSIITAQPVSPTGASAISDNLLLISPLGPGSYSKDLSVEIVSANLLPVKAGSVVVSPFGSGGVLPAGSFSYAITATNSAGETLATSPVTVSLVSGTTGSVVLSWAAVPGATGYNVYGRTASQTNLPLLAAVTSNGWTDTGSAIPSGSRLAQPLATQPTPFSVAQVSVVAAISGGNLAAGTYGYSVSALTVKGETIGSALVTAVTTGSNSAITLNWTPVTGASSYNIYGRTAVNGYVPFITNVGATVSSFVDTGSIAQSTTVLTQPTSSAYIEPTQVFTLNVYSAQVSNSTPAESFTVTLGDNVDGFGSQTRVQDVINNVSSYIKVVNNTSMLSTLPIVNSVIRQQLPAGDSGAAVTDSDVINGWNLFADPEQVYVRLLINGGYSTPAVHLAMNDLAVKRQDCMAFLDMPANQQKAPDATNYRNTLGINSNRSAIFAQDLYIQDSYNKRLLYVPPSGHMAGLAVRTAFVAAPWYPMAGLNRGQLDVLGVRYKYSDGERQLLKSANINYVRVTRGQGTALFEQVTMQNVQSALSWISTRFLMDEIQLASRAYVLYSVHELNDDFLRRQIVGGLNTFLQNILNRRGIKSFLVVCDSRNNDNQTMGAGQLIVTIYLEGNLPADSITLQGVLTKQGADFSTVIGRF